MSTHRATVVAGLVAIAWGAFAGSAGGAIDVVGGQMEKIAPPASVGLGALESDTTMRAFDEQTNVILPSDLRVDITVPGTYDESADLTKGVIPAATVVNSHLIHADPVGTKPVVLEGFVHTNSDILGVMVRAKTLNASDFLGAPGTVYPSGLRVRRLDLDPQGDVVVLQIDRRTLVVRVTVNRHLDQVRVITAGEKLGDQGCSPGFWQQPHHFDSWPNPPSPGDSFETIFGVDAFAGDPTLLEALTRGGGGIFALGRQAVAGLLNAVSPLVDYPITSNQVIQMTRDAILNGDPDVIEATKDQLEGYNQNCPL